MHVSAACLRRKAPVAGCVDGSSGPGPAQAVTAPGAPVRGSRGDKRSTPSGSLCQKRKGKSETDWEWSLMKELSPV